MSALLAPNFPAGVVANYAGRVAPDGWLMCYGQAVARAAYAALFTALCPSLGAFTVTIASPGVVTLNAHGLQIGDRVRLFTSGALPTGLTANTDYYVAATSFAANTFTLSATLGGAAINTSGTQSGTHTVQLFAHGAGDGSTTFNLPDYRGRIVAGCDAMGGTAAGRLTSAGAGIYAGAMGAAGGTETHTLTAAQSGMPSHSHSIAYVTTSGGDFTAGSSGANDKGTGTATAAAGGSSASAAHQNVQPTITANYIIKA